VWGHHGMVIYRLMETFWVCEAGVRLGSRVSCSDPKSIVS